MQFIIASQQAILNVYVRLVIRDGKRKSAVEGIQALQALLGAACAAELDRTNPILYQGEKSLSWHRYHPVLGCSHRLVTCIEFYSTQSKRGGENYLDCAFMLRRDTWFACLPLFHRCF